jgi:hypothetical protein
VRIPTPVEDDRESESGKRDAEVLDRRVGEQPLHVRLHGGEDDAVERAAEADREREEAP